MDKYAFMSIIADILSECKTEEEINKRVKDFLETIEIQSQMSKIYLKDGIL